MVRAEVAASTAWGVDLVELAPGGLAGRASFYTPSGGELAVWCPEDVYIEEPLWLVQAYADACRRLGVQLLEDEPVHEVTLTRVGAVDGVNTRRRRLRAPVVVDAAGAWVRQVAGLAAADVAVTPVRHQLLVTTPSAAIDPTDPITRVVDAAVYLRPSRGGLMVGGFEADPLPLDPRGQAAEFGTDDVPLDLDVLEALAKSVEAEVPLAAAPVADHRGGLFTMSPDGRFVVGPVPDVPGLWVLSGCNGSGFSSSPALGEELAAWIAHGAPTLDLAPLSPARFGRLTDAELVERGPWQYAHYYDPAA
jgi:glycine/D-amino acid oxidase-like deaminating enzyme